MKNILAVVLVLSLFLGSSASALAATLGVTQISAVQTFAEADNTFENGWKWIFNITVPTNETILKMKFADWVNGANTIPAASNIRISSEQSSNATSTSPITIVAANTYSGEVVLIPGIDLDVLMDGRQIQVAVEARIPVGTPGGSYSTSYGIKSEADTTAPVITLIGSATTTIEVGTVYTDAGATAYDNVDGVLIPSLSGFVNTNVVGTYTLEYNVSDSAGNAATSAVRTVIVEDTGAPTIEAPADIVAQATGTSTIVALGTPAVSDVGDPSPVVTNDAPVAGFALGTTTVMWTATDASGNTATSTQLVTIIDTTAPVITLLGDNPQNIPVFDAYVEAGATVTDNYDSGLVATTTSNVDINTIGSYIVHYNVIDSNGNNAVQVTRTVNVIPRPITVTADAKTKVFGAADPALTYTITAGSLHGTDTLSGSLTRDAGSDVGVYAITQGTLSAPSNYTLTFVPSTLTITHAEATVTLTDLSYEYDGTAKSATVVTVPSGLTTDVTYNGSTTLPIDAGTYAVVATIDDVNYTGSSTANLVIDQKEVTLSVQGTIMKEYDGTATATVGLIANGGVGGDIITVFKDASFEDKHVGTGKVVHITNIVLGGPDGANYTTDSTMDTTGEIRVKDITVTAQADTKAYDGTTSSDETPAITPGLAPGDVANFTQSFDTADVGTGKTLTATGSVSDGNSGNNYAITFAVNNNGVITQASQTITFPDVPAGPLSGNTLMLSATSTSGLAVTFTGSTPGVCTVDSNGLVTILTIGDCTVTADQAGNTNYNPASSVSQTFEISFVVSAAPSLLKSAPATSDTYQIN